MTGYSLDQIRELSRMLLLGLIIFFTDFPFFL